MQPINNRLYRHYSTDSTGGTWRESSHESLVVVGHYFIWHARVLTDVDTGAVVSGQQQVTVKGEHMNVAQKSVMILCQQVDRSPG